MKSKFDESYSRIMNELNRSSLIDEGIFDIFDVPKNYIKSFANDIISRGVNAVKDSKLFKFIKATFNFNDILSNCTTYDESGNPVIDLVQAESEIAEKVNDKECKEDENNNLLEEGFKYYNKHSNMYSVVGDMSDNAFMVFILVSSMFLLMLSAGFVYSGIKTYREYKENNFKPTTIKYEVNGNVEIKQLNTYSEYTTFMKYLATENLKKIDK